MLTPEASAASVVPINGQPDRGSPMWWLIKLTNRLHSRMPGVRDCENYYAGDHNLVFATEKFRKAFGRLFQELSDNWCEVVIDAVEERLNIDGFRFGDSPEADKDAWEIWQRNCLDADSQLAHTDMLVTGYGYALVWGNKDGKPVITVESPTQAIVAHDAGSRRNRAAGLKQWRGDDGYLYSVVYLPDAIARYRSAKPVADNEMSQMLAAGESSAPGMWVPFSPEGDEPIIDHPLGAVPLVPLYNRPRTIKPARSEIATVKRMQNATNKLLADLILASEYASYRQRWATGLTLERDDDGNLKPLPFKHGPGNVWIDEGDSFGDGQGARFGEFDATDLTNIIAAIDLTVAHIASQSRTPPHYLNTSADRLSGESIKSSETGLVAKCRRKMRPTGEAWEEVMRLAFKVKGDDTKADAYDAETVWADPESRTEAEHIDAILKKKDIGVPLAQLWEDAGYSPQQIARFKAMKAAERLEEALMPKPAPVVVAAPNGTAPANGGGGAPVDGTPPRPSAGAPPPPQR